MKKKIAQKNEINANPKKGGRGRPIKKGQVLNPGGRPQVPADVRAARIMGYGDLIRSVLKVRLMTAREARSLNMETITLGERAILNAYIRNDYRGIKDYEDRAFGKAPETVNFVDSRPVDNPAATFTDDALIKMKADLQSKIAENEK